MKAYVIRTDKSKYAGSPREDCRLSNAQLYSSKKKAIKDSYLSEDVYLVDIKIIKKVAI